MAIPVSRALADRANHADALIASGPVVNMRFRHGQKALSLRAGKLFHLLVKQAGARLTDDMKHSMSLADLWSVAHLSSVDIVDTVRELASTLVEIVVAKPVPDGGPPHLVTITGAMLDHVERDEDNTGDVVFRFSETMRLVMRSSDHWAVISKRAVLAFESRYSLRLYEILALRKGLNHKTSEVFPVDDLRLRLGVPAERLLAWSDFRRFVLENSIAEIGQLTGLDVSYQPIKRGRSVAAIKLTWREKDAHARKAAARELEASRVGRRARRQGTVETVMIEPAPEPPAAAPSARGKPAAVAFPADGTIAYGRWADLVRHHAPAPTPDVDRVANAFRDWATHAGLPLGGAGIEKAFVTFCKGYRTRR